VSFGCAKDGEYNDLATLFFNTQDDAIRNLFSTGTQQEYSTMALLVFFVAFYGLMIVTYGLPVPAGAHTGWYHLLLPLRGPCAIAVHTAVPVHPSACTVCMALAMAVSTGVLTAAQAALAWCAQNRRCQPAGLFVPGILVGAAYGRLIGVFVSAYQQGVDESTYALLGSASFMAGSMRIVVSVCVMLLELTNQLSLLPLMMIVLVIAKAVGDGSGVSGIYQIIMRTKAFPVLTPQPDKSLRHVTAGDLVEHEGEPQAFARVEQVSAIVAKLRACDHNGFPVLDAPAPHARGGGANGAAFASPLLRGAGGACGSNGNVAAAAPPVSPRGPTRLLGVVLRHHLLVLLRSGRALQHTPVVTYNSQRIAFMCAAAPLPPALLAMHAHMHVLDRPHVRVLSDLQQVQLQTVTGTSRRACTSCMQVQHHGL
jgi:Voltage gated chloride channel